METAYFQSYMDYFWQWEGDQEVIAIRGGSTIIYRELLKEIVDQLAYQGLPSFGSLLLTLVATNPRSEESVNKIEELLNPIIYKDKDAFQMVSDVSAPNPYKTVWNEARDFISLLENLPEIYKTGKKRMLLLQAIFEKCHNIRSPKKSRRIYETLLASKGTSLLIEELHAASQALFHEDFRILGLLGKKFKSTDDIIQKIADLPEIPELVELDQTDSDKTGKSDLVDLLIENDPSFHVGSLVRRIWGGLHIPVHSALPSQQPLGGVSDLTNKGDFDKLLISEFANEDLVFLSRLANNEALYIQREVPPHNNDMERIILLDISLRNWGTPKIIAFATMLAIAKHPKTDIICRAFVVGKNYQEVGINDVESIIDGLQILDGSLNAAAGIESFLKDYPAGKNKEIFVITEPSTLKQGAMLKVVNEYHAAIQYWIYTDSEGNIDVYKKQQSSKKHLQHLQLPLEELWQPPKRQKRVQPLSDAPSTSPEQLHDFPILFNKPSDTKGFLFAEDGTVFIVTSGKCLFRRYVKSGAQEGKGWQLLIEYLPFTVGEKEVAWVDGVYAILFFNPVSRRGYILHVHTQHQYHFDFQNWHVHPEYKGFIFYKSHFYHVNSHGVWGIDIFGKAVASEDFVYQDVSELQAQHQMRQEIAQRRPYYGEEYQNILRKIHTVYINQFNNLVLNMHELRLMGETNIQLEVAHTSEPVLVAARDNDRFFFPDGSLVLIYNGMLTLKSANPDLPEVYVPLVLSHNIGIATADTFAGSPYYDLETGTTITASAFFRNYIGPFIAHAQSYGKGKVAN